MASLPTPRQLLTSIINTLTSNASNTPHIQNVNPPHDTPTNPLKVLLSSQRALLTTLHVLFPPPMLLQALDLLDRGLVTRLIQSSSISDQEAIASEPIASVPLVQPPQAHIHLPEASSPSSHPPPPTEKGEKQNIVYLVRSSQPLRSRFSHSRTPSVTSSASVYAVRLEAWSCTCAAFAFAAFPGASSTFSADFEEGGDLGYGPGRNEEEEEEEWEFGSMSFDGKGDAGEKGEENVPCCKHLLACLLGERWQRVLGGYVRGEESGKRGDGRRWR